MDVKSLFLNSELEELVYTEVPEGVSVPATPTSSDYQRPVACRLLKSIYGLKQSPRAWYGRIYSFFSSNNFVHSLSDHSLFINYEGQLILLLYVHDVILAAPTRDQVNLIRLKLYSEFAMTDQGDLKTILGLEIYRDRKKRTLHLSQRQYIRKILGVHGMQQCKPVSTPADPHVRLERSSEEFQATPKDRQRYQSAVRLLMYAMLGMRSDIAYAVSRVSQYGANPHKSDCTAVKRIFRYPMGTTDIGLGH